MVAAVHLALWQSYFLSVNMLAFCSFFIPINSPEVDANCKFEIQIREWKVIKEEKKKRRKKMGGGKRRKKLRRVRTSGSHQTCELLVLWKMFGGGQQKIIDCVWQTLRIKKVNNRKKRFPGRGKVSFKFYLTEKKNTGQSISDQNSQKWVIRSGW